MSLFIECDTGDLTFDDIIRLVSAVDADGNIYLRTYDDGTPSGDLTDLACADGFGFLDILRGALVLDDDGEYALNVSTAGFSFLLTSVGTGLGVSTLTLTTSADTLITLDGTARFYSDAGGTLNESTTYTFATGASTRYIRCPSATSNMVISANTITSWTAWTSGANAASLSGDISQLTALTYLNIGGNNAISGDVSILTSLTYLNIEGSNTLSGSIDALISLTYLSIEGSNTISGSMDALISLTFVYASGSNTLTGDISLISDGITYISIRGLNQIVTYTVGGDWSSITDQSSIRVEPGVGYGLSSAEVDLFIIEVEGTRAAGRHLHLTLTGSCLARTAASDVATAAIIADGGTVTTNP